MTTALPIEKVIPELREALQLRTSAVLLADPGAGKTTRVPLALVDEHWMEGRRILMLEPRRLAARSAARYMAALLGERVGETVGYRVRLDTRIGPKTRIEVITEGVLTRLLQEDPSLEDVGLVIFDEYHERSLQADLGLALCLQSQAWFREDLRILVMSATLEAEPIARLLDGAPVVASEGKAYPVETRYLDQRSEGSMELSVCRSILHALNNDEGDILVFLPGTGEIRRVEAMLAEHRVGQHVTIAPLHGGLPAEAQDHAVAECPPGKRKVVLATSIAETSLTVAGVRIVIDSGLMRVPRFSPRTGMTRLETVPVSRASADQRQGRAGRQGPGVCYRLWTEQDDRRLAPQSLPELLEADLAPLALELAVWGVADPLELRWLDAPPAAALAQARELLAQLGALSESGAVTPHGRRMAELGLHPRLAHMVLQAQELGLGDLACELAALLSERDPLRGQAAAADADLRLRVEAVRAAAGTGRSGAAASARGPAAAQAHSPAADHAACRRIAAEAERWKRALGLPAPGPGRGSAAAGGLPAAGPGRGGDIEASGLLLAFAYPDRIAQRKAGGRFLLASGRGAALAGAQPLSQAPWLVAAELDDQGPEGRIYLAAPVELSDLEERFGERIAAEDIVAWDSSAQAVRARRRERLGALVLRDAPLADPDPEAARQALLQGIAAEGLALLPWTKTARRLQQRLGFVQQQEPGWPDVSDAALGAELDAWLGPHLYGLKSRDEVQRLDLAAILEAMLSWEQRRELDVLAPSHLTVPSGSRIPVDYSDPATPVLAVRLQELFGLTETPRILRGRVPLTLHLLSPAQRPVQVTRDLASFWQNTYFEVKKDLKGRYPKHYWPDDPRSAAPTNRTRPRE
ncbi:ATP-dependent helicase HrpB [Paenibacillus sp. J2TS4]|uniref:ATP-dependent helicase HrpB n=1 Tax=Paenibacillus sp. J2TS4 TaxID=2807194 RepID=UPI001BCDD618|nr:ATP-dependent helicase HrpB [Paenibacillus sp. J2TS4]